MYDDSWLIDTPVDYRPNVPIIVDMPAIYKHSLL